VFFRSEGMDGGKEEQGFRVRFGRVHGCRRRKAEERPTKQDIDQVTWHMGVQWKYHGSVTAWLGPGFTAKITLCKCSYQRTSGVVNISSLIRQFRRTLALPAYQVRSNRPVVTGA
jgi:hypothetical protein